MKNREDFWYCFQQCFSPGNELIWIEIDFNTLYPRDRYWFLCVISQIAVGIDCSPNYFPYTINIVYGDNAASQTIEIYYSWNHSSVFFTSISGYGKDNREEIIEVCLTDRTYEVICTATYAMPYGDDKLVDCLMLGQRIHTSQSKRSALRQFCVEQSMLAILQCFISMVGHLAVILI